MGRLRGFGTLYAQVKKAVDRLLLLLIIIKSFSEINAMTALWYQYNRYKHEKHLKV